MPIGNTADGKSVWTIAGDRNLRRWNLTRHGAPEIVPAYAKGGEAISSSASGALLTFGDTNWLKLWRGKKEVWRKFEDRPNASIAISPDGKDALVSLPKFTHYDLETHKVRRVFAAEMPGKIASAVAISPKGKYAAWASRKGIVSVYDMSTLNFIWHLPFLDQNVKAVAFSPDENLLFVGSGRGMLSLYDLRSGRLVDSLWVSPCTAATFTSDGRRLVTGHEDGKQRVWRVPG